MVNFLRPITHKRCTVILAVILLAACSTDLQRTNPRDAEAPVDLQAKAAITGTITLEGEEDYSGTEIRLEGPGTQDISTKADGSFSLNRILPGQYTVTVSQRGWEEVKLDNVDLGIGVNYNFGGLELVLHKAQVTGTISTPDSSLVQSANTLVELSRTSGPRDVASGAPAFSPRASTSPAMASPNYYPQALSSDSFKRLFRYRAAAAADGSFQFNNVAAGKYKVLVTKVGSAPIEQELTVGADDVSISMADISLQPLTGRLKIVGTLADGNDSEKYTVEETVALVLDGFNASKMKLGDLVNNVCTYGAEEAYAATRQYTLPSGDGVKTICVRYINEMGEETEDITGQIILDQTAPDLSFVRLNGGVAASADKTVVLEAVGIDRTSGLARIRWIRNNLNLGDFDFVPSWSDTVLTNDTYTYTVRLEDAAGNVSASKAATVVVDDAAPVVSQFLVNGGNTQVQGGSVTVQVQAVDQTTLQMKLWMDDENSAVYGGYTTSSSVEIPAVDGAHTVGVKFKDEAGNESGVQLQTITVDSTPPVGTSILVNAGRPYTNQLTISVVFGNADATQIQLGETAALDLYPWITVTPAMQWVLSPEEGNKTLYVRWRDAAGNISPIRQDSVVLDTTPPELYDLAINNYADYARDRWLNLRIDAWDSSPITYALLGTQSTFSGSAVDGSSFATNLHYYDPLTGQSSTVYLKVFDVAGNASTVTSASIFVDVTAPTGTLNIDTPLLTHDRNVTFHFSGEPGDVEEYQANESGWPTRGGWGPLGDLETLTISNTEGPHVIHVWMRDAAKNESPQYTATVTLDTNAPDNVHLAINGGSPITATTSVTLNLAAFDTADSWSRPLQMRLANDAGFNGASWQAATTSTNWNLDAEGSQNVYAQWRDPAGNLSAIAQAHIVVDEAAPEIADILIDSDAAKTADPLGDVTLTLFAADTTGGSGIVGVRIANSATAVTAAPPQPYEQTKPWVLTGPSGVGVTGTRTVCAMFHDYADNRSPVVCDTIEFDRKGPSGTIAFWDPITNDVLTAVDLTYDADTVSMKLSNGPACAGGSWVGITDATLWNLGQFDGNQSVSVRFLDDIGNEGGCFSDTITMDSHGPIPASFGITGNVEAQPGYSNTALLTASFATLAADCAWVEFSEDIGFANTTDSLVGCNNTAYSYALADSSDGSHTVYLRFYDLLDNPGNIIGATIIKQSSTPLVTGGGFVIDQGLFTNQTVVNLTMSATGADLMKIIVGGSDCSGGSWITYATASPVALGGAGSYTIRVAFATHGGNQSTCYSQTVTVDTSAPAFAMTIAGSEGISGRTANQVVTLDLSSVANDATEMMLSNYAGFPGAIWQPLQLSSQHLLIPGDGAKTVYSKIRDRSGNESSLKTGSIQLDQTPPDPPALQLFDLDGDGYAVTSGSVELLWTVPANTDYFDLYRYILGVDAGFKLLSGSMASSITTYVDPVTWSGLPRQYRLRARDDLGNTSAWSLSVIARPYNPVTNTTWIKDQDQYKIDITPERGVFQLDTAYKWEDTGAAPFSTVLGTNIVDWLRPKVTDTRFNEALSIRQKNSDNSLLQDSLISLPLNRSVAFGVINQISGGGGAIVVRNGLDPLIYYKKNTIPISIHQVSFVDGNIVDESLNTGGVSSFDAALDPMGNPVVVYESLASGNSLKIASKVILSDSFENGVSTANWVARSGVPVTSTGSVYEPYGRAALQLHGGGTYIRSLDLSSFSSLTYSYYWEPGGAHNAGDPPEATDYLRFQYTMDGTSWSTINTHSVAAGSDTAYTEASGSLPAGVVAVRFINNSSCVTCDDYFIDGVEIKSANWVQQTLYDPADTIGDNVKVAVDGNGVPHAVYYDSTSNQILLTTRVGGIWNTRTIDTTGVDGKQFDFLIDRFGYGHIAYYDSGANDELKYATNQSGNWASEVLESYTGAPYPGKSGVGIAQDSSGLLHIIHTHQASGGSGIYWIFGTSGSWSSDVQISSTESWIFNTGFAVAADAYPRVLFKSYVSKDPVLLTYDGTVWAEQSLQTSGDAGWGADLAIDKLGNSLTTFGNITSGQQMYVKYSTDTTPHWRNGAYGSSGSGMDVAIDRFGGRHFVYYQLGSSKYVGPDGIIQSIGIAGSPQISLAVDENARAHIAVLSNNALHYVTNKTGVFVDKTLDSSSANIGFHPDIVVDAAGVAHISYIDYSNSAARYINTATLIPVVVDSSVDVYGATSIVLDHKGYVHMSFGRNGGLGYANDRSGTMTESIDPINITMASRNTALAVDSQDRIHALVQTWQLNDVYYAVLDQGSWHAEYLEQTADVGKPVAISIDSSDRVFALYKNAGNNSLNLVVRQDDGSWLTSVAMSACEGDDAHGIGVAIDKYDILTAVCQDVAGGIKFTTGQFFGKIGGIAVSLPTPF